VMECYDYLPFGRLLSSSDNGRGACHPPNPDDQINSEIPQKFTGKERDAETGLDYFGARYLSAAQGRWTSPDAPFADQHPGDPQSWNLYSYVRNNPVAFVDPTGAYRFIGQWSSQQQNAFADALSAAQTYLTTFVTNEGSSFVTDDAANALSSYGTQGSNNGVFVMIAPWLDSIKNVRGYAAYTQVPSRWPFWMFWKWFSTPTITVYFAPSELSSPMLSESIVHEGMHVAEGRVWLDSGKAPNKNPTRYAAELRAYQVQNVIFGGHWYSNWGFFNNTYVQGYEFIVNLNNNQFFAPPNWQSLYTWMPGWNLQVQTFNINLLIRYTDYGVGPGGQGGDMFPLR